MKTKKGQKKKYTVKKNKESIFKNYHEIFGILIFALGVLTLLSFYFKNSIGIFGSFIRQFLLGTLGLSAFIIPPVIIIYAVFVIFRHNLERINMRAFLGLILIILATAIIQTIYNSYSNFPESGVMDCIVKFYEDGENIKGGGVIGGLISMPFILTFQTLGTIIILISLCLIDIILLTDISIAKLLLKVKSFFTGVIRDLKNASSSKKENKKTKENEENDFKAEFIENDENPHLDFKADEKVIDFKIQKASKELKENINNTMNTRKSEDVLEDQPVQLIIQDVKKNMHHDQEKYSKDDNCELLINDETTGEYRYPPLELLADDLDMGKSMRTLKSKAIEGAKKLEETLNSFGVAARVINVSRGPSVTRYEIQPNTGVKVSKIVNLADDIALNLASSGVRIEAPIPGKAAIGIEVPNKEISSVLLRSVIQSKEFQQHPSKLAFAIGKDISGECMVADISKMPHLLIAGATGAGKSVCINSLIISLIYKASPQEVKLLMVDPKVVELGIYNGIPHLLIPVVTDPRKAAGALNWAVQEMVNRYKLFADRSVRDIKGYNELLKNNNEQGFLPHIVIIIDELADLMMVAPNDVEDAICRLAQMARAAGMHLVIATQRPSVDVITGVIKANIPSRISFAVSSQVDSRTILDMAGAEKLLGKGDMLFYPVGQPKPVRVQGAFVSEKEVEKIVEYIKSQGEAEYDDIVIEEINTDKERTDNNAGDNDELLPQAIEMVIDAGQASVSLIQRKFKVGYARAARIIDQMEARSIVGGFEGSKPRQILISKQQWHEMQMRD